MIASQRRGPAFLAFALVMVVDTAAATLQDPWIPNDLPAAQAEARKTGKPIFAVLRCER